MIIGVDEVGRGSWAGPVCVAAVAWPDTAPRLGLADSKALTREQRQKMAVKIRKYAPGIGIGWVDAKTIDEFGLTTALQIAARSAVMQIGLVAPIVMDGREKFLGEIEASYIIKADNKIPAVMAASIIAKVARDTYMHAMDHRYAGYKFASHVGYGTKSHRQAIAVLGPSAIHRLRWSPLQIYAQ